MLVSDELCLMALPAAIISRFLDSGVTSFRCYIMRCILAMQA